MMIKIISIVYSCIMDLHFSSLPTTQSALRCMPHTHTFIHSFTHRWHSLREQFGVQQLAQGHFDMRTGDRTADLPISGQTALPPEPQQPRITLLSTSIWCWKKQLLFMLLQFLSGRQTETTVFGPQCLEKTDINLQSLSIEHLRMVDQWTKKKNTKRLVCKERWSFLNYLPFV